MRSVVVTQFGGPGVLEMQDVPVPAVEADEVLIRVHTAGINYADIMQREGLYPNGPKAPFPAGFEVSGVIEQAGASVRQWEAGDEVMAFCRGGYSDFAIAKEWQVMPKPEQVSMREAAALPCQYLTAYHALLTLGRLREGQTVLIQAAAGGLGTMLVQVANNTGAVVIGTAGSAEKCAYVKELGAHHAINYKEQDFQQEVLRITGGKGCDLVIESVGGEVFDKSLRCLKPRGMLVTLGLASREAATVNAVQLLANNWIVAGFHLLGYTQDREAMAKAMRDLHVWLLSGILRVVVGHLYPLAQAAQAQQDIRDRKTHGKVVLAVEN